MCKFRITASISKKEAISLMQSICDLHKLKLCFLKKNEGLGPNTYNYAGTDGKTIMLSIFKKNKKCKCPIECMLIAFFHEFAHCVLKDYIPFSIKGKYSNNTTDYLYELLTTFLGINYAMMHHNILFSDDSVKWIMDEAFTYSQLH